MGFFRAFTMLDLRSPSIQYVKPHCRRGGWPRNSDFVLAWLTNDAIAPGNLLRL